MEPFGRRVGCACVLIGIAALSTAHAAPPVASPVASATQADNSRSSGAAVAGFGVGVDRATLAALSGGSEVANHITINGSVSDTSTTYVRTGFNSIDGGAFGNAVGLPMVIQNSGNSVLIQNATIVNLQVQP